MTVLLCLLSLLGFIILMGLVHYKTYQKKKAVKKEFSKEKKKKWEKEIRIYKNTIYKNDYAFMKDLKNQFDFRKKEVEVLIEKIFPAPQLTNNKFLDDINVIEKDFYKVYESLDLFFAFYPKEDSTSKKIINDEMDKLLLLHDRLVNIIGELSVLILKDDINIKTDKIKEDIEEDTESIRNYLNGHVTLGSKPISNISKYEELKALNHTKRNIQDIVERNATGVLESSLKRCKDCQAFLNYDSNLGYCFIWEDCHMSKDCCENFIKM